MRPETKRQLICRLEKLSSRMTELENDIIAVKGDLSRLECNRDEMASDIADLDEELDELRDVLQCSEDFKSVVSKQAASMERLSDDLWMKSTQKGISEDAATQSREVSDTVRGFAIELEGAADE